MCLRYAASCVDNESGQPYLESKFTVETSSDDAKVLLERICRDPGCHAAFADVILKVCIQTYPFYSAPLILMIAAFYFSDWHI